MKLGNRQIRGMTQINWSIAMRVREPSTLLVPCLKYEPLMDDLYSKTRLKHYYYRYDEQPLWVYL